MIIEYCDTNNDGTVDMCELFECIVNCENEWRAEYCPDSEPVYCANPYVCPECEGEWTCEDIYAISQETIAYYDTNGDG
jgi:hypothetical protein